MMKPTKISRTVKVQYTRIYEYEKLVEMGVKTKKKTSLSVELVETLHTLESE